MQLLTKQERQIAFPAAVRLAGYGSIDRWCLVMKLTPSYVYQVLRGMDSERIEHHIDDTIMEWLGGGTMKRLRARLAREDEHRRTAPRPTEPTPAEPEMERGA